VKLLKEYNAFNETTYELSAILLENGRDMPAWITSASKESVYQQAIDVLEKVLKIHKVLKEKKEEKIQALEKDSATALFLKVLPSRWQQGIALLTPTQLAAAVLSLSAGKILAYKKEGKKWRASTPFINLSGRGVLHSIPSYRKEFSLEEQNVIRKALTYAKREGPFGKVKVPKIKRVNVLALRQWLELIMIDPTLLNDKVRHLISFGYAQVLKNNLSKALISEAKREKISLSAVTLRLNRWGSKTLLPFKIVLKAGQQIFSKAEREFLRTAVLGEKERNLVPKICEEFSLKEKQANDWLIFWYLLAQSGWAAGEQTLYEEVLAGLVKIDKQQLKDSQNGFSTYVVFRTYSIEDILKEAEELLFYNKERNA
ncbi:MAG: hypothetical protein D6780_03225, partial [Candidatus Dadabacteria bacterium]